MSPSSEFPPPTLFVLRKLLRVIFLTDVDFDAFCLDHFRDVYDRFSRGMDGLSKTNLLLALTDPVALLKRLSEHYSNDCEKLELISSHLAERDSAEKRKADVLG